MGDENLQIELKNKRICRFCMTQNEPLTNIYSRENRLKSSAPLPLQIMACVSIEVFTNDGMPSTICDDCRMLMEHCYRFKQMCKKSDNLLRQYPLIGTWAKPLEIPKLSEELIYKMYPNFNQRKKTIAATQTDKKEKQTKLKTYTLPTSSTIVINATTTSASSSTTSSNQQQQQQQQQQQKPRLLNKNSVKILNKDAQKNPEPILSQPIIKRDSAGNVEIITEIIEQTSHDEQIDPLKSAAPVETNVFPCPHCERSFPLRQLLDIHMVNHNRERSFQCNICTKRFFSKYDLGKHMLIHTGEKPYECVVCKKAFTRSTLLHRHEKIHTDQPKFLCVYCERPFLSKEEMDKHAERHRKNRPFVCKICNKAFAFKQGLERHETIHAKNQPYPCQYCDHSFSTPSKLARHLTAHAGERPFPCKLCPKSYLLSHHLTRHLRSHKQGSGSYKCFDCEKVFTTRDDLIYHSAVHATQTLICPLCKEHFDDLDLVTEHIKNHAEGEQFACEFCDLIFMTPEKLQQHSDKEHSEDLAAYQEHDKSVNVKKETSQNSTDDSQESLNNNEELIQEFFIEEYHQDEDEQQQQQQLIDNVVIKEEHEILLGDNIIITTRPSDDNNIRIKTRTAETDNYNDSKTSKFMQQFEEYSEEIEMDIETLSKELENEEYIIDEIINDQPPAPKIIKLSGKEEQKIVTTTNLDPLKIKQTTSTTKASSYQPTRKIPAEKKQRQQPLKNETASVSSIKSKESDGISTVLKQLPKSVTITKKENTSSEKSEELSSTTTKTVNKKSPRLLNSAKIVSSTKNETTKKSTAIGTSSSEKSIKQQKSQSDITNKTNKTEKQSLKNSPGSSTVTAAVTKESPKNVRNSNNSPPEIKEKRISNSSTKQSPSSSSSSSLTADTLKTNDNSQSQNKKLVEMMIGDRKVKVQKIMMTKAQVALMAKEGKIEMKGGAMILKQDNNKNASSSSSSNNTTTANNSSESGKMMTRSKQQQSTSK